MVSWNIPVILVFLAIFSSGTNGFSIEHNRDEGDTSLGRLPLAFVPLNYTLELQPDIYTGAPPFLFSGSVEIRIECRESASTIYLNSEDLNIEDGSVSIALAPDSPVQAPTPVWIRYDLDPTFQFFKLYLEEDLVVGAHYILQIGFNGTMNSMGNGFGLYYASYESLFDGQTKYIATTLMWASSAREVFPCFDEPQMKATFDVTLLRKDGMVALANTDSIGEEDRGNGWTAVMFETTPPMSTYLQCYIIGTSSTWNPSPLREPGYEEVRVWAVPDYAEDLAWANTVAASLQESHETWTGIRDPLSKMDHIAIPGFGGAMENWGLVTYSYSTLLYNSSYSSLDDERLVPTVIAHELAHMWFGNMVTLRWWNDAWLNEGFATFFEHLPLEDVLGWSAEMKQQQDSIRGILVSDSSANSVPVRRNVDTPLESTSAYTSYAYNKGGAVLRMIRQVLGPATFQRGLQRYLNSHLLENAVTDDLWNALTDQADEDGVTDTDGLKLFIKEKFDPWVDQRGYPLVTLDRTAPGTAAVTQTQFLSPAGQATDPSPYAYEWYVPLTLVNQETLDWSSTTRDWLNRDNKTVTEGMPVGLDQWFVANINQDGFYRVKYDNVTYSQITDQLDVDSSGFPASTRHSILNDAAELEIAGLETAVFVMEATRFLDQEDTFMVWDTADRALSYPDLVLARYNTTYDAFQTYLRSKVDPPYTRLGWVNDPADDNYRRSARALVLSIACSYMNPDCEAEANVQFDQYQATPSVDSIFIDHRETVYCSAIRTGDGSDWSFLHAQYLAIANDRHRSAPPEIDRILASLACSADDAQLQNYIDVTFDPASIRSAHTFIAIDAITNSPRGRWVMWSHLKNNWNNNPVPPGVSKSGTFLDVVEGFANADDVLELEDFIAVNPPADQNEADLYDQARGIVDANKAWADRNEQALQSWLLDHTP